MVLRHMLRATCFVLLTSTIAAAGPLDPPPGPVAATGPTVITALPFTISTPGSYILTKNLTPVNAGSTLTIEASNVTIDLRGFTLQAGSNSAGVTISGAQNRIVVANGNITGVAAVIGSTSSQCRIENIAYTLGVGQPFNAISLGDHCTVRHCTIDTGRLLLGARATVEACAVSSIGTAIETGVSSFVRDCAVPFYGTSGSSTARGIKVGDGSAVSGCTVQGGTFGQTAFSLGGRCIMDRCTVDRQEPGNVGAAVEASAGCLIHSSTFRASGPNLVSLGGNCTLRDCAITMSNSIAVAVVSLGGTANRVERNTISMVSSASPTTGISAGSGSFVEHNVIDNQGISLGISVAGVGSVIDGNRVTCAATAKGIEVVAAATNNIVLCNSVTGPTSLANAFSGTANNTFGPIIDARLIGQLNGTTANQAHPWANFWY